MVRISGSNQSTTQPPLSVVSDVSTSFQESQLTDDAAAWSQVGTVELSGQLVGDIGADAEEDGRRARHGRRSSTSRARA